MGEQKDLEAKTSPMLLKHSPVPSEKRTKSKASALNLPSIQPMSPTSQFSADSSDFGLTDTGIFPVAPLVSVLRRTEYQAPRRISSTERRVRGLWNTACQSLFSSFRDDLLVDVLSNLNMSDLLSASMVSRRWEHCASNDRCWEKIDATDFIHKVHLYYSKMDSSKATEETCLVLEHQLKKHKRVSSLTIRSIGQCLSADLFLPSLHGLQELILSGFEDLTDTHVHVLFLSARLPGSSTKIRLTRLALEECPLLTDTTLQTVARYCQDLDDFSIRGNAQMSSLSAFEGRWDVATDKPEISATSSLAYLFAPAPPMPGPPRMQRTCRPNIRVIRRLDISGTRIDPSNGVLASLSAAGGKIVRLY